MQVDPAKGESPRLANGRFIVQTKLGNGSFGDIFAGLDTWHGNREVAIKLEHSKSRHPQLLYEAKVYKLMHGGPKPPVGIPQMYWCGTEGDYHVMVMDLCGPCLEDLFTYCGRQFSTKTVYMLADQMLRRIEHFHSCHFLHRDIKPENFVMGLEDKAHCLYVVDFGLSKRFWDLRLQQHIPYKEGKPLTGTARYCSVNTHLGVEQSRRDDLESIGFLLVYFARGSLPWQGLRIADQTQKMARIGEKKIATSIDYLCRELPPVFAKYMKHARTLKFEEQPNYEGMRAMFREQADREGLAWDFVFDWVDVRRKELSDTPPRSHEPSSLGAPAIGSTVAAE